VVRGQANFYAAPVTAGALYQMTLTELSDDVDLFPFDDDQTFSAPAGCMIGHFLLFGTDAEDCTAAASSDRMYFAVGGSDVAADAATYTIAIRQLQTTSLPLSAPVEASISPNATSLYSVAVTPGTPYSLSITGLTDSSTILHVTEKGQGGSLTGNRSPKQLRLGAVGSTIYLAMDGSALTKPTSSFRILATPAPVLPATIVPTSGRIAPRTPMVGWVETRGTSRYWTDGLADGIHTISVVGETGDVHLQVYGDDTYSREFDCTLLSFDRSARECTFTGTRIYFAVSAGPLNRDGAGYIMLVW
jgi:hypothetical protein